MGSMNNAISETHSKLKFFDRLLAVYESCLFMADTYEDNEWQCLADLAGGYTKSVTKEAIVSLRRVQKFDMLVSFSFVFCFIFIFYQFVSLLAGIKY
jgi:hypothetical protein